MNTVARGAVVFAACMHAPGWPLARAVHGIGNHLRFIMPISTARTPAVDWALVIRTEW